MSKVPPPGAIGSLAGTVTRGGVVVVGYPSPPEFTPYSATASVGVDAQSIRSDLEEKVLAIMMDGAVVRQGQEDVHRATHLLRPMYIAGDDVGLGFTPAPIGVTAFMNWETKRVEISWKVPTGGDYDNTWRAGMFGTAVFDLDPLQKRSHVNVNGWINAEIMTGLKPGQYMFSMIGLRNGIPSGPASVFVDQCRFIEATDPPFVNGLHPNWERLELAGQPQPRLSAGERKPGDERPREKIDLPSGAWVTPREFLDADIPKGKAAWTQDPGLKTRFQVMEQPAGIGAVRRRIMAQTHEDRFHVSVRLRTRDSDGRLGGAGDVAYVWNGHPDALEGVLALGSGAIAMNPDMIPLDPTGEPNKYGWTEFSTEGAAPLGVPPSAEGLEASLVIVAESLGTTQLEIDWLAVEKLNCNSETPADYNPHGIYLSLEVDPATGESVWIKRSGPPPPRAE